MSEAEGDRSVPDRATREIAVYGVKYRVIKRAFYKIDKMIDWLERRNEYLKDEEITLDLADSILSDCPEALTMPDKDIPAALIKEIQHIREFTKNLMAIKTLRKWRIEIDLWGRFHGSVGYGERMVKIGIPDHVWKVSSNVTGRTPIAFSTLQEADNV